MNGAFRHDNAIGSGSIPKIADLAGLGYRIGRIGLRNGGDTNGHKHEVVKEAVMISRFPFPASRLPRVFVGRKYGDQIAQMSG
jgi:hypothetical protein